MKVNNCRLCGSNFFPNILDLGATPLANELYPDRNSALNAEKFELAIRMCINCKHVQLNHTVEAKRLFDSYVYSSSTSKSFQQHFIELAEEIKRQIGTGAKVIEIGSNDGFLVKNLETLGLNVIGIEPSKKLAEDSRRDGLEIIHSYFDDECVGLIQKEFGLVDLVVGNNVFAHIHEIKQAMTNVFKILKPQGIFVFEVAYLGSLVEKNLFDSIYHEHISYHSLYPMNLFLREIGFTIEKVNRIDTHGGSIRIWAKKISGGQFVEDSKEVQSFISDEVKRGLVEPHLLDYLTEKLQNLKNLVNNYDLSRSKNNFVFGYTAPAKLVTFLSQVDLSSFEIQCIVDDNADKQGKFVAGFGFEIVSNLEMIRRFRELTSVHNNTSKPLCIVFAWNLSVEIVEKIRATFGGEIEIITFKDGIGVE